MKFRQFVGEDKVEKIKKIVEKKPQKIQEFSYNINKKDLKRTFDYIKSWLIRYKISFRPINPYLTLYEVSNVNWKDVNESTKIDEDVFYDPYKDFDFVNKKFITLYYKKNKNHMAMIENVFRRNKINIVKECIFIKLFEINDFDKFNYIKNDMLYSIPKNPIVKLGNLSIIHK